jgi:Post-segregation antitoxin CcdA
MNRKIRRSTAVTKSRTTLTLPADSLQEAHRIARSRRVNLSTVVAEALAEGLRVQTAAERSAQVLDRYTKAFAGFTEEELAVLDGIILEPLRRMTR